MPPVAEVAAVTWPLAMTLASVAVADRFRGARRRRALNRALHELRRPLQALVLSSPAPLAGARRDHVALALDALAELDRKVNGAASVPPRRQQEAKALAVETIARWRRPAALAGRRVELVWRAGAATLICDPSRIARALDNLVANALEHGGPRVRLEATRRTDRLRLVVADGADAGPTPGGAGSLDRVRPQRRTWLASRPRDRGHGLAIVASIAAEHGGRFAICRHERGARAVLELPLVERRG
ncbi:MAG: sensor histidine kinase [Solirubrobacterales bacterium]